MRQRIQGLRNGQADGGFTLIELLIVIIVLGILAGIAVFGVARFRDDAELAACEADVKTVQTAVEAYMAQNPGDVPAIGDLTGGATPYLKTAPETAVTIADGTGNVTAAACP